MLINKEDNFNTINIKTFTLVLTHSVLEKSQGLALAHSSMSTHSGRSTNSWSSPHEMMLVPISLKPLLHRTLTRSWRWLVLIRGQYLGHLKAVLTNQRPASGQVISINQSKASIQVIWSVLSDQRPVFKTCYQYWPIRCQCSGHVMGFDQSEASNQ